MADVHRGGRTEGADVISIFRARHANEVPGRLALGTGCARRDPRGVVLIVLVVGTWASDGAERDDRVGQDPRFDRTAHGYLLAPIGGNEFIPVPFEDVASGDLKPMF